MQGTEKIKKMKRSEDNINKRSKIDIISTTKAADGRTRCKGIAYAFSWTLTILHGYGIVYGKPSAQ